MTSLSALFMNLSDIQQKLTRSIFQLNSKLSVDALKRRLSNAQEVERFIYSGEKLFCVFIVDCLPFATNRSNTVLSKRTIADFVKQEMLADRKSFLDENLLSNLFFFLFACVYQGDEAKAISMCTRESQDATAKVAETFAGWLKENNRDLFETVVESHHHHHHSFNENKKRETQNDDEEQIAEDEHQLVLENNNNTNGDNEEEEEEDEVRDLVLEETTVASTSKDSTTILIGHATGGPKNLMVDASDIDAIANDLASTTVREFNAMRIKYFEPLQRARNSNLTLEQVLLQTLPLTVCVRFASKTGGIVHAYGKFCCGGVRPTPTQNPGLTKPGDIEHKISCIFHPQNNNLALLTQQQGKKSTTTATDAASSSSTSSSFMANRTYHSGQILETRMTKTSGRNGEKIARWTCCSRPAVAGHNTETYQFIPESENGCCPQQSTNLDGNSGEVLMKL